MIIWLRQACFWLLVLPTVVTGRHAAFVQTLQSRALQSTAGAARTLQQASHVATPPESADLQTAASRLYSPELDLPVQRQALLDLYVSTSGPGWIPQNMLAESLQADSPARAPSPDGSFQAERVTFLTEQLTKFKWGTPGVSYCLWQALDHPQGHSLYLFGHQPCKAMILCIETV